MHRRPAQLQESLLIGDQLADVEQLLVHFLIQLAHPGDGAAELIGIQSDRLGFAERRAQFASI